MDGRKSRPSQGQESSSNWRSRNQDQSNSPKTTPSNQVKPKCNHCKSPSHSEDDCWLKYPEKRPKRDNQNKANNVEVEEQLSEGRMFDTGACTSLISKDLAVRLKLYAYPYKLKFQSANQNVIDCNWFVPLKVYNGDEPKLIAAYVIDDLSNDILLGENIIKATHLIIVSKGLDKPYELKHQNLNSEYRLKMEIPDLKEIELMLQKWYKTNYDMSRLHYNEDASLLINKIEEFQDSTIDFPEEISNLDHKLYQQINKELCESDKLKIHQILMEERGSFSSTKFDLGCVPAEFTKFKIDIGNKPIPKCRPFRSSEKMRSEIRKIIKDFKENGIIEDSDIGGGAPAFVVPKPNGTWRMVTSYVELNKLVQKRKFPMPNIDDAINQLKVTNTLQP
ncbi:uncharacterized protein LOC128394033 [Panonychus citri]|uniref:uncharacterized protein LOC128394033 n=1 Tax=Panonychus citri TaxID=50023 RepID=UPI002306EA5C|nr:uncharacterized protein LOC128394033 [Panonychus citri]